MKKLLVMLLAVSMVLSMSFALVACSDDPADTSKDASTAASGDEASKTDSADVESTDASVAESTDDSAVESTDASEPESADVSVDDSEEPSEEPSQAPAIDYKTSPAGTNYATNSTYSVKRNGDDVPEMYLSYKQDGSGTTDWADLECKKLIDGIWGDPSTYESGVAAQKDVTIEYCGTDAKFEFLFDLGDHYGDIKSLFFRNARHGTPNGNNRGFEVVMVQVSDDGINWNRVKGNLTDAQVPNAVEISSMRQEGVNNIEHFNFTYTFDEVVQGQYVKIVLSNDGGYVLQLEELEIRN